MLTVRPMTESEFTAWRRESIEGFAAQQVESGVWAAGNAVERATAETEKSLPQGLHTPDHLLLVGEEGGVPVGHLWIALNSPRQSPGAAFLYEIRIEDHHQGKGYGRQLLTAAEEAARANGRTSLVLNVYGTNTRAIRLYETAGYEVITQQMRKPLKKKMS
ncbi:GNAT family N-acetyltransferase [Actinoplanes sp. NPDC049265]|uniref:GNAT family N-acetyltransferase n=1 Tax=Actinoplanes sp. NPDC049265 TaxID=3363902 RepID=UPI00371002B4